ncbi:MAG: M20/M25/M40 family metallo-hydrolase [Myxococcota bacterium]
MRPLRTLLLGASLVLSLACSKDTPPTTPPTTPAATEAAPSIAADAVRPHVERLASDALQGRAPGTDGDTQTQDYIDKAFADAGLVGGFDGNFRQPFEVGDGVRTTADTVLEAGRKPIVHGVVPFTGRSGAEVSAKLVFVGYGVAPEGKGSGDYEKLGKKVKGKIVVARAGSEDPHASPATTRPQQKLINARDHGAVGFILWEPNVEAAYPNHGEANDLSIPALWVGKEGTPGLVAALGGKGDTIETGAVGRKKARMVVPVEPVVKKTANVVAVLKGNGKSTRSLVVGAHMDHLGMGTSTSLAPGEEAVHNGADDNASGVAVVLELARALSQTDPQTRPFDTIFITFGAEEMGLLGSKHYVEALGDGAKEQIVAMLNFDMVGRLGEDGLQVAGVGTSSVWPDLVKATQGDLEVTTSDDGYGPSDHGSFYEAGVPVLHFFTGSHADYHKPSDDVDKINFEGAAKVGSMALAIVTRLQADAVEPDYIKVARKQSARGGFRVSLGTMPDYGAQVDGVRLSGVREGGAAAVAGLQKGDVVQKLGKREVHNLDDYMAALAELEPDVEIDVVVLRGEESVPLRMTPGQPRARR